MFPRPKLAVLAAILFFSVALIVYGCGGGGSGGGGGGGGTPAATIPDGAGGTEPGVTPNGADEVLFQKGLSQYASGDFTAARISFEELAATYPSSVRYDNAGFLAGLCSYNLLDYSGTVTTLSEMLAANPDSTLAHAAIYYRARSNFEIGTTAESNLAGSGATELNLAEAGFTTLISSYPASRYIDNAIYYRAQVSFTKKDYSNAILRFGEVLALSSSVYKDNAQYYLGLSYFERAQTKTATDPVGAAADFASAETELAKVEASYPASQYVVNSRYYLGRVSFEKGDYTTALARFESVLDLGASSYADNAQYYMGRSYFERAQSKAATDPAGAAADFASAETELAKVEASYPASQYVVNSRYYLGRVSFEKGDYTTALARFKSVLDLGASSYADNAQYYSGRSYYLRANEAEAVAPGSGATDYNLAITEFAKVKANYPASAYVDNAEFYKAVSRYKLGQLSLALNEFLAYTAAYPASIYIDNSLYYEVRIYVDQGNCTNADAVLAQLSAGFPSSVYVSLAQTYKINGGCP